MYEKAGFEVCGLAVIGRTVTCDACIIRVVLGSRLLSPNWSHQGNMQSSSASVPARSLTALFGRCY